MILLMTFMNSLSISFILHFFLLIWVGGVMPFKSFIFSSGDFRRRHFHLIRKGKEIKDVNMFKQDVVIIGKESKADGCVPLKCFG